MDSMIALEMQKNLQNEKAAIGKPLPTFSFKTPNGVVSNASLKGQVVFINFWFASCAPCLREFAGLNQLYQKLYTRKDFVFISFTYEKPEVVNKIRAEYSIPYAVISISQAECRKLMQDFGYPISYVVSRKGVVQHLIHGGEPTQEEATKAIMSQVYPAILKQL
ncbi:MAG TPA: TlpA disulfide reductase family protein [Chitinophagaceae bacterium]|nr:TlpA disulfide reductase family protein [Chitinophagaceae bacterium]